MKKQLSGLLSFGRMRKPTSRFAGNFLGRSSMMTFEPLEVRRLLDAKVQYILEAQDLTPQHNKITNIDVGQSFQLALYARDVRDPKAASSGVIQGYIDVSYLSSISSATATAANQNPDAKIAFDAIFESFRTGKLLTGKLEDIGAADLDLNPQTGTPPPRQLIWTVPFVATAAGSQTFTGTVSTAAGHGTAMFLVDGPVANGDISFVNATLTIGTLQASIANKSAAETNAASTIVFDVSLTQASGSPVTVVYHTVTQAASSTTATSTGAGADFTPQTSGTVTFAAGQTVVKVTVAILGDSTVENSETFQVVLDSVTGGGATLNVNASTAIGTITNDDFPVIVAQQSVSQAEGNASNTFVYELTLQSPSAFEILVPYHTEDHTATLADNDYVAASGTVTFAPGQTSRSVTVTVVGDTNSAHVEGNEEFHLILNKPSNASFSTGEPATRLIDLVLLNDDGPRIKFAQTTVTHDENDEGETAYVFNVILEGEATQPVIVHFATANGTATLADQDYVGTSTGTLSFAPGVTSQLITVRVKGDTLHEANENFLLNLSDPENATLFDSFATGVITNDDDRPILSISDPEDVTEGTVTDGFKNVVYTVSLSAPTGHPDGVSVNVSALGTGGQGSATAGVDFEELDNDDEDGFITLHWAPNETAAKLVTVRVKSDNIHEANETYELSLFSPVNAWITEEDGITGTRQTTIIDDDPVPVLTGFADKSQQENANSGNMVFSLTLSNPSDTNIVFTYVIGGGNATAGTDYTGTTGTVTFLALSTTATITVPIVGDTNRESDETFNITLTRVGGAVEGDDLTAVGTIQNDDEKPTVTISPVTASEGGESNGATTEFKFVVTLSGSNDLANEPVVINYETVDGTAKVADGDYISKSATLSFAPGVTSQTITIVVNNDALDEENETFSVRLNSGTGVTLAAPISGLGTITDNDNAPTVSIDDITPAKAEGDSGTTDFVFKVKLNAASGKTVKVAYQTADGTAKAATSAASIPNNDYNAKSGTVTFAPGTTEQLITVQVRGDDFKELNEDFLVNLLANPENATLGDSSATATIQSEATDAREFVASKLSGKAFNDMNFDGDWNDQAADVPREGPLAGLTVSLESTNLPTKVTRSATTDEEGAYSFENLAPGEYVLTFSSPTGYGDAVPVRGSEAGTISGKTLKVTLPDTGVTSTNTNAYARFRAVSQRNFLVSNSGPVNLTAVTTQINIANKANVTASGTGVSGDKITLTVKDSGTGNISKSTTVGTTGTWSVIGIDVTALADGAITYTATATNGAGKFSTDTSTGSKDTVAPTGVLTLADDVNSGNLAAAHASGTGEVGAKVSVIARDSASTPKNTPARTTTVGSAGTWEIIDLNFTGLADGAITYVATFTDAVGNTTERTKTASKNSSAPTAAFADDLPTAVNKSNFTNFPIRGTGTPGANILVVVTDEHEHETGDLTTTVAQDGTWTLGNVNLTALDDDLLTVALRVSDNSGNSSLVPVQIIKDIVEPTVEFVSITEKINAQTVGVITVTVVANEGDTISLSIDDTAAGTTPVSGVIQSSSPVQFSLTTLQDGTITFTATVTDAAGNVGTATAQRIKDTVVPNVAIDPIPAITNANQSALVLTGTGEVGAQIRFSITDGVITNPLEPTAVAVGANGTWTKTVNVSSLANGTITFGVTAVDVEDNQKAVIATTTKSTSAAPAAQSLLSSDDSHADVDEALENEEDWLDA